MLHLQLFSNFLTFIFLALSFNFLRRKVEMKSDGTTGVTPKNEKTNDFMKKMLSAITKTSQKPKVPAVSPFQKKKPSILVNGDGMTHKVMSVTQIKTDLKKVLEKNDQKDHKKDLKLSEKEKGKENTIQKQNEKEETKPNVKETTSVREESEKEMVTAPPTQNKKEPEVAQAVTTAPPAVTQMVTKSSTIQKDNKENGNKTEPTLPAPSSITHSSTVPLTTPVPSSDLSKDKAVIPTTKAPVTSTSATPSVPTTSIATTSVTSKTVTSSAAISKPPSKTNQPQPKKQTPIEKVKQLLSARAKVKKQPITEPIKPKTLIGSSEIEHVLKAVKLPETNSETISDSSAPSTSSSSNQNQLLSTQKETTIKNEEKPKNEDIPKSDVPKTKNISSSSLEPCLLDPIPSPSTKETPPKESPSPAKTPSAESASKDTSSVAVPSSVAAVPPPAAVPLVAVVPTKSADTAKPSVPTTELEETKVISTISSTSNPDKKSELSLLTDSQSNASNPVATSTEKGSDVNVKIVEKESESPKPVSALDLSQPTKDLVSTEIPKEPEIPPIATSAETTATKPVAESIPSKETVPVPDPVVPPTNLAIPEPPAETPTPSSSANKPEVIDKPIPNKAIVNLISSEMAPGSPGADSEDDLPLDVIVIKKSSKEPEPKKEPTPAPPPTQAASTESIMTVNPVEAPIGQPTGGVGGSMSIFDQPTGSTAPLPESSEPNTPTANPLDLVFGPDGGDDNIFGNAGDDPSALLPDIFGPTSTPPLPTATSHPLPGTVQTKAFITSVRHV